MPTKPQKKPVIKRKQNGKKAVKGQMGRSKQKYEMETSPKEQISELDKEILSIKINEHESKLNRKKHLCSYIEEEICIYKTLYEEKQLLKSESMKLLNKAFEDFSTEIFLLDQELSSMQHTYEEILHGKSFCSTYKERVKKLSVIEEKLAENLFKAEKCVEELPALSENLAKLEEEASKEKEKFMCKKQQILREFETCLFSIQNELNLSINKAVKDDNLKLDLLPAPYKRLFMTGFLSKSWLDFAKQFCSSLQLRNSEIKKTYCELLSTLLNGKEKVKIFFLDHDVLILLKRDTETITEEKQVPKLKKLKSLDVTLYPEECYRHFLQLEKMSLEQQNKIKSMKSEIKSLESAVKSLEISGETTFEKSYLVQIICKASSVIKQDL